jgi:uroporphyrinogen-III synthase
VAEAAPLAGVRVLITRPYAQSVTLAQAVRADGGEARVLPLIDIRPLTDPTRLDALLATLDEYDLAIFISPNAVEHALARLAACGRHWPATLPIAAIGAGTAQALAARGLTAGIVPRGRFDSEGLLAEPALQSVNGQRVLILRGEGGRALLADTLAARGAAVTYAECYRRAAPAAEPQAANWLAPGAIDVAVFTSGEAIDNLLALYGDAGRRLLRDTQVLVVSERLAGQVAGHGPRHPPIVAGAGDAAIVRALRAWRAREKTL